MYSCFVLNNMQLKKQVAQSESTNNELKKKASQLKKVGYCHFFYQTRNLKHINKKKELKKE